MVLIGADHCVKIEPSNAYLTAMLAGCAGLKVDAVGKPSMTSCKRIADIMDIRNTAQANEIDPGRVKPKNNLFESQQADAVVRPRRGSGQVTHMRDNPQLFRIDLPSDDGVKHAWVQRPIRRADALVVRLDRDNESLTNVFTFIVSSGFSIDDVTSKRKYKSSGQSNVWKFGEKFYERVKQGRGHSYKRIRDAEHGSDHHGADDGSDSDGVVGEDELPDVDT